MRGVRGRVAGVAEPRGRGLPACFFEAFDIGAHTWMHWLRFLKPPTIVETESSWLIRAVLTITTDLGETFFYGDAFVAVHCQGAHELDGLALHGFEAARIRWTPGMRALPFDIRVPKCSPRPATLSLHIVLPSKEVRKGPGSEVDGVIPVWSSIPATETPDGRRLVWRRFDLPRGLHIKIMEETGESIARHIWDAGYEMMRLFVENDIGQNTMQHNEFFLAGILARRRPQRSIADLRPVQILELGSGCGIGGLTIATLFPNSRVVLTDLPDAEAVAQKNIAEANKLIKERSAEFEVYDWDGPAPKKVAERTFDMILIADCTYNPDAAPALVRTISSLVEQSPRAFVLVATKKRHPDEEIFFRLMKDAGLTQTCQASRQLANADPKSSAESVDFYRFEVDGEM